MQERPYKVYARVDDKGRIVEIRSDAFGGNTDGLTLLGEGWGDRYHHAQGNFLPGPLRDARGVYRYMLVDGRVEERTEEEMAMDVTQETPPTTLENRLDVLEEALEMILKGVVE